ncbi:hypothetical protein R2F25_02740 [Streptomyces sp. UP1A-1]|nr:hypothetical protein [Streptomyces sp. UP1A-1]
MSRARWTSRSWRADEHGGTARAPGQTHGTESGRGRHGVAATATGTAAAVPAQAAEATGRRRFDSDSPRFTLAVLPDTQYLFDADSTDPAPLRETFRHLVTDRSGANIAFMTHLGDVTEHGTEDEIRRAAQTFRTLHGKVPYSVLA